MATKTDATKDVERNSTSSFEDDSTLAETSVGVQIARERDNEIKFRSCSWQKTAALLFSEYICLAILSFPWSFSVLGLVPGIIVTLAVAATVLYTSLILWRYCLKHPEIRDVCDIGKKLFGGARWAYNVTAVFFILNNTFIQALHVLVGAKLLNTLTESSQCTVVFAVIATVICLIISLPRTLRELAHMGTFSAVTMGIAVLLAIIFAGVQKHPFGYVEGDEPIVTIIPVPGTSFVAGMSAFLNISYTFIGQITLPSFIAEMENPKDFPKALWAVTIAEMVVFTLCGALMYHFIGNQYMTSPGFGSLQPVYKKIAFSFAIPTIVFLGSLYSTVTARFIFFRLFKNSRHRHSNSLIGWSAWVGILTATWVVAFVIAEVIPFFSDMLSLMSSLFGGSSPIVTLPRGETDYRCDIPLLRSDGWFGFIFWALAYFELTPRATRWAGLGKSFETLVNYFFILLGLFILVAGTYVSVQSIIDSYHASNLHEVFTCASNAL
ncbi:hypothetical protein V5O48_010418 [Marasmius crinis-equi]|uniref:Amino acid transporter transmembrane domain-containing protein n=1 Tax=Marasmius crinis-equi TaxID=585013 RepID=A0ABR3F8Q3_9AGAR